MPKPSQEFSCPEQRRLCRFRPNCQTAVHISLQSELFGDSWPRRTGLRPIRHRLPFPALSAMTIAPGFGMHRPSQPTRTQRPGLRRGCTIVSRFQGLPVRKQHLVRRFLRRQTSGSAVQPTAMHLQKPCKLCVLLSCGFQLARERSIARMGRGERLLAQGYIYSAKMGDLSRICKIVVTKSGRQPAGAADFNATFIQFQQEGAGRYAHFRGMYATSANFAPSNHLRRHRYGEAGVASN